MTWNTRYVQYFGIIFQNLTLFYLKNPSLHWRNPNQWCMPDSIEILFFGIFCSVPYFVEFHTKLNMTLKGTYFNAVVVRVSTVVMLSSAQFRINRHLMIDNIFLMKTSSNSFWPFKKSIIKVKFLFQKSAESSWK